MLTSCIFNYGKNGKLNFSKKREDILLTTALASELGYIFCNLVSQELLLGFYS